MSEWRRMRAGDAFSIVMGRQRSPGRASGPNMTSYLRSANVGDGRLHLRDVKQMDFSAAERERFRLRRGDVLVSEGSASAQAVGMTAVWNEELPGEEVCFQNTLLRFRGIPGVSEPGFVLQWCRWAYESGAFRDASSGSNIKHIGMTRAAEMPVLLPPVAEQRRIVDVVAAVDAQIGTLAAEATRLSAMTTTFRSELFGHLDVPSVRAGDKFDMLLGRQKSARQSVGDHVLPYLRAANITPGALALSDVQTMNFEPHEQEKYGLHHDDIVLVEGGSIGQAARWQGEIEGVVGFDKHVIRLRAKEGVSVSEYALQWCHWARETGAFDEQATGITIKALGFGRASSMPVPDLTVEQQEELVASLAAADAEAARIGEELGALRTFRSTLLTSLLSRSISIPESYDALLEQGMEVAS